MDHLENSFPLSTTPTILPTLPSFIVIEFLHYKGSPWNASNPNYVPIPPIKRGSCKQVLLHVAWGLTIHKAQGTTLKNATIYIWNVDRQGLAFTAISRVKSLSGLRISLDFSFSRYSRMQNNPYVQQRKQEEYLLDSKSLQAYCP